MRTKLTIGSQCIAVLAQSFRKIEHNSAGHDMKLLGQRNQRLSRFGLCVRRVNNREPAAPESLAKNFMQQREGIFRSGLIVLVVGYEPSADV